MNFAQRQRDPRRHLAGITAVILFHGFIVYALVTGLAKKVVEVVRAPIETKVIEEIKKPPPPAEIVVPPPPKLEAPPPPFIPPPEVQIATPPPPQPTITAVTPTPPPAPVVIAPAPPPVVAAPPAPPPPAAPAQVSAAVVCPNFKTKMGDAAFPRDAARAGLEKGEVLVQFTLGAGGEVKNIKALRASHPIFARAAMKIVEEYTCQGQGHEVVVQVPFSYKLE
jgi:periplasmic protein TonB